MKSIDDNIVLKCYLMRFGSPRFSLAGWQTLMAANGLVCFSLGSSQSDVKVQENKMDSDNTHAGTDELNDNVIKRCLYW